MVALFFTIWTEFLSLSSTNLVVTTALEDLKAGGSSPSSTSVSSKRSMHHTVTIIGAGAAGLGAAYHFRQQGMDDVIVLEASEDLGGRMRKDTNFVDSETTIDTGASFHSFFKEIMKRTAGEDFVSASDKIVTLPFEDLQYNTIFGNYSFYDYFVD